MPRKRRRHLLYEKRKRRQQQIESSSVKSSPDRPKIDAQSDEQPVHEIKPTETFSTTTNQESQRTPYQIKNENLHHYLKPLSRLAEKEKDEPELPFSFIDEAFCIEARVTVKPEVSVGGPTIECLEAEILPSSHQPSTSEECTMLISQIVRITIPVRFSAQANGEASDVRLAHADEDADSTNDFSL